MCFATADWLSCPNLAMVSCASHPTSVVTLQKLLPSTNAFITGSTGASSQQNIGHACPLAHLKNAIEGGGLCIETRIRSGPARCRLSFSSNLEVEIIPQAPKIHLPGLYPVPSPDFLHYNTQTVGHVDWPTSPPNINMPLLWSPPFCSSSSSSSPFASPVPACSRTSPASSRWPASPSGSAATRRT